MSSNILAMDLQAAVIAHLSWKAKLSDFFYGVEQLRIEDVPDYTRCDFGKWLYSRGLQELAMFPETGAMEVLHKEVHDTIKELVSMPKEKRTGDEGQRVLARFRDKCDRLVDMLENMEMQLKRKAA
uniref:CZB domain-containing protein n=1 Tax=Candidatus Electronema sp. TaxID=2698783 RepID=UPI004055A35C